MKSFKIAVLVLLPVLFCIIGYQIFDSYQLGWIDYRLHNGDYNAVAEFMMKHKDIIVSKDSIHFPDRNECNYRKYECPKEYLEIQKSFVGANITDAEYSSWLNAIYIENSSSRGIFSIKSYKGYVYSGDRMDREYKKWDYQKINDNWGILARIYD